MRGAGSTASTMDSRGGGVGRGVGADEELDGSCGAFRKKVETGGMGSDTTRPMKEMVAIHLACKRGSSDKAEWGQ